MISQTLDLLLSMVVVILLASLLLGSVYELFASYFNQRGRFLRDTLSKIYSGADSNQFISMVFSHPDIHLLKHKGNLPSYIPDTHFARATLETVISNYLNKTSRYTYTDGIPSLQSQAATTDKNTLLKGAIMTLEPSDLKTILNTPLLTANNNDYFNGVEDHLKKWYNNYQDRTTGWYKRKVQTHSFWIALGFAIMFNFNIIDIYIEMKNNVPLQHSAIALGEKWVASADNHLDSIGADKLVSEIKQLQQANFPFGYKISKETDELISNNNLREAIFQANFGFFVELIQYNYKWHTIPGWILSSFLLMIQSSVWFNLLSSLFNIRNAGLKPKPTNEQ